MGRRGSRPSRLYERHLEHERASLKLALPLAMRLDTSTVSFHCYNHGRMNLSLEKWLLAQTHRDEPVGELARKWVSRRMANTLINKPLEFDKIYNTKILKRANEINAYLRSLF